MTARYQFSGVLVAAGIHQRVGLDPPSRIGHPLVPAALLGKAGR